MGDTRVRRPAPSIQQKLDIYENVLSVGALSAVASGVSAASGLGVVGASKEMVQEGEGGAGGDGGEAGDAGLIPPRRLPNPCLDSPQRMDLHRELMFNQKIGKSVLNQKSELQKALSKHKEKKILNQEKEHKETPELERAIAERARRLAEARAEVDASPPDPATNPHYLQARARLRHADTTATTATAQ